MVMLTEWTNQKGNKIQMLDIETTRKDGTPYNARVSLKKAMLVLANKDDIEAIVKGIKAV